MCRSASPVRQYRPSQGYPGELPQHAHQEPQAEAAVKSAAAEHSERSTAGPPSSSPVRVNTDHLLLNWQACASQSRRG